ncbi:TraH family protein [Phyllobacterium endophyticum]|uniref:Conjugal transfer protein TraH n=1 Tax=Phyllobacterium endophyticum TaxID=1149773 RepID=A0A2P7AKG7_9HYPH|nr:TraH family protein [Phyllobacterium endophyticum]MBB3237070.1 hypothetical protein [Phyllobacterium endophyticum]PSH54690.1 conjugal transfer protein TraH [Phyllobacterium endophyticum]TYR40543.1 conjugal transfer protein TraH [Phyllobacterium endophyticum]
MVDAALIKQCADAGLKPAIVKKFIERAGSPDPLTVTVRSGNRVVLVPKPNTVEEAMDLIRQNVGRNVTRVGITQYPAGLGILEAGQLKTDMVDPCENIRMGTALFAKVYRIVVKWYGSPVSEAFDDAIIAWQTGYFEGKAVFTASDPGAVKPVKLKPGDDVGSEKMAATSAEPPVGEFPDANKAGIRIDLSGVGAGKP